MMLEVKFSVAMLSIATGTYVAGLYGMNVINGIEEASNGFSLVTSGSVLGMVGVALFGLHMLRRIKRIYHLRRTHNRVKTD
jgi:magnesium transporter